MRGGRAPPHPVRWRHPLANDIVPCHTKRRRTLVKPDSDCRSGLPAILGTSWTVAPQDRADRTQEAPIIMNKIERAISIFRCPRSGTSLSLVGQTVRSASGETYPVAGDISRPEVKLPSFEVGRHIPGDVVGHDAVVDGKPILVRHVESMHTEKPAAYVSGLASFSLDTRSCSCSRSLTWPSS
jgi:hypothetical protein